MVLQQKVKLNEIGISTVLDLAVKSPSEVADAIGSDSAHGMSLCSKARAKSLVELIFDDDFVSASEIYKRRKAIERISTGSETWTTC